MNAPLRKFDIKPAARENVPLLIGLVGPSGSGKTYSALRLASGIQKVSGGEIFVIDTEARRAAWYADDFRFQHLEFKAPYGSLDYLAALEQCVTAGAKTIVVDSMSHEHIGPGGYLLTQEAELDRMAGSDWQKRERVKMAAWIKPSSMRQRMITGILQLNANFIFCFRAKEKTKPLRKDGKTEIVEMGFMPIAGEELLFEMTVNCLLPPKSEGVPQWRTDQVGEKLMMKLPEQFKGIFAQEAPLSEDIGRQMAEWAKGGPVPTAPARTTTTKAPTQTADTSDLKAKGYDAASRGMADLETWWKSLPARDQQALKAELPKMKDAAKQTDEAPAGAEVPFDADAA